MHSGQPDRNLESQIIFRGNYNREGNLGAYNSNHMEYNTAYLPGERNNIINSRTLNNPVKNNNFVEQNYHHTYLKCSKSQEYEFNFGKYENENYVTGCKKMENEHMTFESLKIENLSSNISITVNYENRQDNMQHSDKRGKTIDMHKQHLRSNNIKNEERIDCADLLEKDLKPNVYKNEFMNDIQSNVKSNSNNKFFSNVYTQDGSNIRSNNYKNNLFTINNDNINDRNNSFRNNNIINTTNNNIYNKYNINNLYNETNSNINFNDNNNNNGYINKINRRNSDAVRNVNTMIKNEDIDEYKLPYNVSSTDSSSYNNSNNYEKRNLCNDMNRSSKFDYKSANQNITANACFNSLHAKYPDISFNLPDCKIQQIKYCTESPTQHKSNDNNSNNQLTSQSALDNAMVTIAPPKVSSEVNNFPQNFKLRPEVNINCVNKYTPKSKSTNKLERDVSICSNVIRSNPNFCYNSKIISKNQYDVSSSSYPCGYKKKSDAREIYDGCSNNFYQKQPPIERSNNFFGNGTQNINSDLETNIEIKPHVINKSSFSTSNKKIEHVTTSSSPLSVKLKEQLEVSEHSYNTLACNPNSRCITEVDGTLKSYISETSSNQESCANTSLFIPMSSTTTKLSSHITPSSFASATYSNDNNMINKDIRVVEECRQSYHIENLKNSKQHFLPPPLNSEDNSLKCTIRWSEARPPYNKKNHNLVKHTEIIPRSYSKSSKRGEKILESPNYRELLNKAYALKNARSENDLNLEIIRRTLKCNVPLNNSSSCSTNSTENFSKAIYTPKIKLSNSTDQQNFNQPPNVFDSPAHVSKIIKKNSQTSKTSLLTTTRFDQQQIQASNGQSPLDLSVKTIKTIADSTASLEPVFTSHHKISNSSNNNFLTLPKIDFHPNFSIATVASQSQKQQVKSGTEILDLSEQNLAQGNNLNNSKVFSQPLEMNSVRNIDVKINIKSAAKCMGQNISLNNKCTNTNMASKCVDIPSMDSLNFSITSSQFDRAVDLTSRNTIIKPEISDGNINNLKAISELKFQTSNFMDNTPVTFQVSKKECDFDTIASDLIPHITEVKQETLTKSPDDEFTQSKIELNLKPSNKNENCKGLDNIQITKNTSQDYSTKEISENKYLIKQDNEPQKNVVITESLSLIKSEHLNEDLKENKVDIDSLRIRTKAELKGFDLTMIQSNRNAISEVKEYTRQPNSLITDRVSENELSLMDWNNKCNDFVTQLVCNSNKKLDNKSEQNVKQSTKDFLNTNCKFFVNGKNKNKFNISNINNNSAPNLIEEKKALTEDFIPKKVMLTSYNEDNTGLKIENCLNESNFLNGKRKSENNFKNKICRKHKNSIVSKVNQEINLEEETKKGLQKENFTESYPTLNQQNLKIVTNENILNANNDFDPNKVGFFDIKTRKRKFTDSYLTTILKEEKSEKSKSPDNSCKKSNVVMTKAEMKFREKNDEISSKNSCPETLRENSRPNNFKTVTKSQEISSIAMRDDKNAAEKILSHKKTKLSKKNKESVRIKTRKVLLRNVEYNRILRNKKIVTRGNLSKSYCSTTNKNKSYLREKNKSETVTLSNKHTAENQSKKNQKRITRASSKSVNLAKNFKNKMEVENTVKSNKDKDDNKLQSSKAKLSINKNNTSKFPPNWEHEVFEYKKSLKIPLRLITVKGSQEFNSSSTTSGEKIITDSKVKDEEDQSIKSNSSMSSKSIIDILHSRAINLNKEPKRITKNYNKAKSERNYCNKISTNNNNTTDNTNNNNSKKSNVNHFSVFDTKILKARTRTESKMLKTKEHIREIFVGEDRPASAPPEMLAIQTKSEGSTSTSFEEKFKQYLEEMNRNDYGERVRKINNSSNAGNKINDTCSNTRNGLSDQSYLTNEDCSQQSLIKEENVNAEEDDVEKYVVPDNLKLDQTCQIRSTKMYKQKRPNKYRKKGSSGFDYIKKKKKLTTKSNTNFFIRKKNFPKYFGKKTENDVCKEIKNWVINKSLGQSYLHKAARLGYLDVIAYCLERLNMNPNPKDNAGYTPLHEACQQGRIDIARLLLQYGANHSQAAHSGIRPLHEASETGYIEIVRLLLSYGADPLLTTYAGQTPLMLADTDEIEHFILNHVDDIQNNSHFRKPWTMYGPWKKIDMDKIGYNELNDAPDCSNDYVQKRKNFNSLGRSLKLKLMEAVSLNFDKNSDNKVAIRELVAKKLYADDHMEDHFECEESDIPLPPLYTLKDEGSERWLLLNDLCHILKIKSKETLLKQIVSSASSTIGTKELLRELKITDFIEKATCLQLLCAGEKLNIQASKVVLIKYNDQVKSLLGVEKTILNF